MCVAGSEDDSVRGAYHESVKTPVTIATKPTTVKAQPMPRDTPIVESE